MEKEIYGNKQQEREEKIKWQKELDIIGAKSSEGY